MDVNAESVFQAKLARGRLRAFYNSVNATTTRNISRIVMAAFRGRNRTEWDDETCQHYKSIYQNINYVKHTPRTDYNADSDDEWILDAATGFWQLNELQRNKTAANINYVSNQQQALTRIVKKAEQKCGARMFPPCQTTGQYNASMIRFDPATVQHFYTKILTNKNIADENRLTIPQTVSSIPADALNIIKTDNATAWCYAKIGQMTPDQKEIFEEIETFIALLKPISE